MIRLSDNKLPLGIMRQAIMKMDSFISDIHECMEDEDVTDDQKYVFQQIVETAGNMEAAIVNMASVEIPEEDFLRETITPDPIDPYPGTDDDLLDEPI